MRPTWCITAKDLLLRTRDRSAILVGIVVPLVLAFIFNAVFSGAFGVESLTTIGFVDEDGGQVAQSLVGALAALDEEGTISVEQVADRAALRASVEEGEVGAGIVVPEGFSSMVLAGEQASLRVVGEVDSPTTMAIARSVAQSFSAGVEDAQRAVQAVLEGEGQLSAARVAEVAEVAATAPPLVTIGSLETADRVLDPATFYSAGMAAFFLFFLVQFGVIGLIDEEREGTLTRLRAAPIPRWSVVAGKGLTSFLLGMLALTVLAVSTTFLMGADWGDPLGLAVLFVALTLAATSLLGIVGALARTPDGAGNLGAVIAVGMGMLGGTFFPLNNRLLETLSLVTPHSWFLRGIGDLRSGDALAAAPSFIALALFSLAAGSVAAILLARRYR